MSEKTRIALEKDAHIWILEWIRLAERGKEQDK